MSLELSRLREVNVARCARWHGPDSEPWVVSDWTNAMCGEAGEAANVAKKIRRQTTGAVNAGDPEMADLIEMLGAELADTVIYADLVAAHMGIDLAAAIADKFNVVSERHGFPERLP
jgi:NTP pyrophosphatase (non-canonical NTP hydrolase)